jgi:hypothetical protein
MASPPLLATVSSSHRFDEAALLAYLQRTVPAFFPPPPATIKVSQVLRASLLPFPSFFCLPFSVSARLGFAERKIFLPAFWVELELEHEH